jgi:hypothetical protein
MTKCREQNAVSDDDLDWLINPREQTPEEAAEEFRQALVEFNETQRSFAGRMIALGDRRKFEAVLRSIQRMASGEAKVSGEMQVIMTLLKRERARTQRRLQNAQWHKTDRGGLTATVDNVVLHIFPQKRGQWSIGAHYDEPNGYSPPWPHWRDSLEEAKLRAIQCVDETLDQIRPRK